MYGISTSNWKKGVLILTHLSDNAVVSHVPGLFYVCYLDEDHEVSPPFCLLFCLDEDYESTLQFSFIFVLAG